MIRQLAHVCLGMRNLDTAVDFYTRLLGFDIVHEYRNAANERYGVFLHCGGRTFLELFNDQERPVEGGLYRHMCFEVADLPALAQKLTAAGFPAEVRRGRVDSVLLATMRDPEGNEIEFQQYDDQSKQGSYLDARRL